MDTFLEALAIGLGLGAGLMMAGVLVAIAGVAALRRLAQ